MLITTTQLARFSGVYPEDDDLQTIYINSASQKIADYVGFDPETNEDFEKEVSEEKTVYSEDGETFYSDSEMTIPVTLPEGVIPVIVSDDMYKYYVTETRIVPPDVFKLVCLEIATLMQAEENTNLGVNTTSEVGVNRTFLNVVNYDKYLERLASYRKVE